MNQQNLLNPGVYYIEPVEHPEFLCHAVYQKGRTMPSSKTSEALIDELLLLTYGTTIKVRRQQLKKAHNIHKTGPIVIDERLQFVLFPLTVSRNKNPFWVNLHHFLRFSPDGAKTLIHFYDGTAVPIDTPLATCDKQYAKALKVTDQSMKIKAQGALYITDHFTYASHHQHRYH